MGKDARITGGGKREMRSDFWEKIKMRLIFMSVLIVLSTLASTTLACSPAGNGPGSGYTGPPTTTAIPCYREFYDWCKNYFAIYEGWQWDKPLDYDSWVENAHRTPKYARGRPRTEEVHL